MWGEMWGERCGGRWRKRVEGERGSKEGWSRRQKWERGLDRMEEKKGWEMGRKDKLKEIMGEERVWKWMEGKKERADKMEEVTST